MESAELKYTTTILKSRYHEQSDMIRWCQSAFGQARKSYNPEGIWTYDQIFGTCRFSFKEAKHLTWFKIIWG